MKALKSIVHALGIVRENLKSDPVEDMARAVIQRVRTTLDAGDHEGANEAALRVVAERDGATADRDGWAKQTNIARAERDAAASRSLRWVAAADARDQLAAERAAFAASVDGSRLTLLGVRLSLGAEENNEGANEAALRVVAERDRAIAERDKAIAERDAEVAHTKAARAEAEFSLTQVQAESDKLAKEQEVALTSLQDRYNVTRQVAEEAIKERDQCRIATRTARTKADKATKERDEALKERDVARVDLESYKGANVAYAAEVDDPMAEVICERDEARIERDNARELLAVTERSRDEWIGRLNASRASVVAIREQRIAVREEANQATEERDKARKERDEARAALADAGETGRG